MGLTHPPSDLRRNALYRRLTVKIDGLSHADAFHAKTGVQLTPDLNNPSLAICPPPDQLFALLEKKLGKTKAAMCVELIPYMDAISDTIFDAAHAYLQAKSPALIYRPSMLQDDLAEYLGPLCDMIPPIESIDQSPPKAASLATVLNVGWAALLTRLDVIPPTTGRYGDESARRMERLHDLLLKAVELSEARQVWAQFS